MKKRVSSILLALLLILTMVPTMAWAAAPVSESKVYSKQTKTEEVPASVSGTGSSSAALPIHGDEPNVNTSIINKLRNYILNHGTIYNDDPNCLQVRTTLYLDSASLDTLFVLNKSENTLDMFCTIFSSNSDAVTSGSITLDISNPSSPFLEDTFSFLTVGKLSSGSSYTVLGIANNFYMSSFSSSTYLSFYGFYKIGSSSSYNFSNDSTYNDLGTSTARICMSAWAIYLKDITGNGTMNDLGFSSYDSPSKPVLISSPNSVSASEGSTATFSVSATGGNLSYRWQYRTSSSGNWLDYPDGTSSTLYVTASAYRNGYQYRCKISNSAGTVYSNTATLTVIALSVTSQPKPVSAYVGDTATFTVKAQGGSVSYQWQYKAAGGSSWNTCSMTGNKTATLSVPVTAARNGYQYRCKVTSGSSTVYSSAAKLTVKTKITSQPANASVAVGDTAKFTVKATGPSLTYQWQYKAAGGTTWNSCSMDGNKTATLSVPVTTARNGYQYRCKITDANGTVTYTNNVKLTVKVSITSQPADVAAGLGDTAKFTVKVSGTGAAYQWQYKAADGTTWNNCSMDGNKTATLSVPVTAARNGYQYRCKITLGGTATYSNAAKLTVKTIVTSQPANVTSAPGSTVKFSVKATGVGLTYQWQYLAAGGTTWNNCSMDGNRTATLSVPVTAGRNGYQYRCRITDANGAVTYSNAATLTTIAKPEITSQPCSAIMSEGATVIFDVSASGTDISYQWQYRTSSDDTWKNSSVTGAKTNTLRIEAALYRDGYQYRCKVSNAAGEVYSNAATLMVVAKAKITAQPKPAAVIVNKTATFSVQASGEGLSYQWQYNSGSSWNDCSSSSARTATLSVTAESFRNGYQYRCIISNAAGDVYSDSATLYACDRRLGSGLYWTLVGPDDYSGNKTAAFAGTGAIPDYPYPDDEGNGSPWSEDGYLGRVVLAPGVTGVGSCAFTNCTHLHQVVFPDSVTSIGDSAFEDCFYAADGVSTYTVTIPAGVTRIGDRAFADCGWLSAIRVEGGNRVYSSADGVLYNRAKTELIQVPGGYRGSLTIPNSVTTIARDAMSRCSNLTAVTIPDSVTAIGRGVFQYCERLTEIKIPKGVREIGDYTFYYCKNLSEITIPDSVETIGYRAFCECKYMSAVRIGSGVKSIGQYAFQGCSCLTDVYYNGTAAMWNQISIASGNNPLNNATIHYLQ